LETGERKSYLVHERSRENEGRKWAYRSVLDKGLKLLFEEDEVEGDEGLGPTPDLVDAIERLIAAIAALLLADTSFVTSCALVFILEMVVVVVTGFGRVCVVAVLQVWSDGNRCWGQNWWLHF